MNWGEIIQIIGDCISAIIAVLAGHHVIRNHLKDKEKKPKTSKKDKQMLKIKQKLEKLNEKA